VLVEGDNPGYVFATAIDSGQELWRYQVRDPESSPVLSDGVVYIGSGVSGNAVLALRARESDADLAAQGLERELWRSATPYPAVGAVSLRGDLVLIGCGTGNYIYVDANPVGAVLALDRTTGAERWRASFADAVLGAVATAGDRAVVGVRDGTVVCLNLADGSQRWRSVARTGDTLLASPALTDSTVYVMTSSGWLVVMDADTGAVLEQHYANTPGQSGQMGITVSSPVVYREHVYVGTETAGVVAYEGLP
jgi:outer membrane protein assembly factor BamB